MHNTEFVPYLSVTNANQAVEFYSKAFQAEPTLLLKMPDGTIMHCEFQISGARLFLSEELLAHGGTPSPNSLGGTSVAIHLYVDDCDSLTERLVSAGAELLMPPMDMFWGERFARVRDPFGHEWGLTTRKISMTPEQIQAEALKLFNNQN